MLSARVRCCFPSKREKLELARLMPDVLRLRSCLARWLRDDLLRYEQVVETTQDTFQVLSLDGKVVQERQTSCLPRLPRPLYASAGPMPLAAEGLPNETALQLRTATANERIAFSCPPFLLGSSHPPCLAISKTCSKRFRTAGARHRRQLPDPPSPLSSARLRPSSSSTTSSTL